jgi:hypothetical protein
LEAAQSLTGADAKIDRNVPPCIPGAIDTPTGWSSGRVRVAIRACILPLLAPA